MGNYYPFVKDIYDAVDVLNVSSTLTVNQGDMVAWDPTNRRVIEMTNNAAMFLGVSLDSNPFASLTELTLTEIRVKGRGINNFKTTASETYTHKTKVAMGADSQTVTTVIGGKTIIGEVYLPGGSSVTGATGTYIPINLFGCLGDGGAVMQKQYAYVTLPAVSANSTVEQPVLIAPYPMTVTKASVTPVSGATNLAGNTNFSLQLRDKGTAGAGTAVLCTLGTTQNYAGNTEYDMGTITNANLAQGEVLAAYNNQGNPGLAFPVALLKVEYVLNI